MDWLERQFKLESGDILYAPPIKSYDKIPDGMFCIDNDYSYVGYFVKLTHEEEIKYTPRYGQRFVLSGEFMGSNRIEEFESSESLSDKFLLPFMESGCLYGYLDMM